MSNITDKTALIRNATFGRDVREALASGIEAIDSEVVSTTADQTALSISQGALKTQFDDQIENMTLVDPSSAEMVAGHTSTVTGKNFDTIGKRLDDGDSQMAQNANDLINIMQYTNVKDHGAKGDGVTDDTVAIQSAINSLTFGTVRFTEGTYLVSNTITVGNNINIICEGRVIILSSINTSIPVFNFLGNFDDSATNNYAPYTNKLWFDGGDFGCYIKSINLYKGIGLKIGANITSSTYNNARTLFRNISIANFDIDLNLATVNVYLICFDNVHLTSCNYGIRFSDTTTPANVLLTNSGENFKFYNCLFSHTLISAVQFDINGGEFNFYGCSFDFNECVFSILKNGSQLINIFGGHIEGITYASGNEGLTNTGIYGLVYAIVDTTILTRPSVNFFGTLILTTNTYILFNICYANVRLTNVSITNMLGSLNMIDAKKSFLASSTTNIFYNNLISNNEHAGFRLFNNNKNLIAHNSFDDILTSTINVSSNIVSKAYALSFQRNVNPTVNVITDVDLGKYLKFNFSRTDGTYNHLQFNITTSIDFTKPNARLVFFPILMISRNVFDVKGVITSFDKNSIQLDAANMFYKYVTTEQNLTTFPHIIDVANNNQFIIPCNQFATYFTPSGVSKVTFELQVTLNDGEMPVVVGDYIAFNKMCIVEVG